MNLQFLDLKTQTQRFIVTRNESTSEFFNFTERGATCRAERMRSMDR